MEVAGVSGLSHAGQLVLQRPQVVLGDPGCGLPSGDLLQGGPHGVDLAELLDGDLADAGALVRLRLDEPHRLELPQRLANRRLADTELRRQHALLDSVAGA